jgi:uncharacterized protein (TIGR04222 family)
MLNHALSTGEFIVFCGIVCLVIAMPYQLYFKIKDPSRHLMLPEHSDTIDPYAIAYLREGTNELIRLLIIHLTIKGFLQVDDLEVKPIIFSASSPPDINKLNLLEREVFNFFVLKGEQPIEKIFVDTGIPYCILGFMTDLETQFHHQNLLTKESEYSQADSVIFSGYILFVLIVIMQVVNSGSGTVLYFLIGILAWIFLLGTSEPTRVNHLGRRYLAKIQAEIPLQQSPLNIEDGNVSAFILSIAVLGLTALENTPFIYFKDVFDTTKHKDSQGSGGCSCGGCG